jgi:hypothetical protein
LLPELELIIGCIVALSRMLWQLKDSDVDASLPLLDTMLAFAHRHARQRNALALLESSMQLLFFTYRRDNNAPLFGPFVLLPDALQRRAIELRISHNIFATCKTPTTTCAERAAAAAATFWLAVARWRPVHAKRSASTRRENSCRRLSPSCQCTIELRGSVRAPSLSRTIVPAVGG